MTRQTGVRLRTGRHRRTVPTDRLTLIGGGGEATVYQWPTGESAVKIWHVADDVRRAKLARMLAARPEIGMHAGTPDLAWPTEAVLADQTVVGFVMPRIDGRVPLGQVLVPRSRRTAVPGFDWRYLMRTARNLAATLAQVHAGGYVVGDLNESNVLVAPSAAVTLVDCDSFQMPDGNGGILRSRVGKSDYTPPELAGASLDDTVRTTAVDCFAFAVLTFQLLMEGTHPFAGVWHGEGEPPSIAERIASRSCGFFPDEAGEAWWSPPPTAPPLEMLPPEVAPLMRATFGAGLADPAQRPDAATWLAALSAAERHLTTCPHHPHHVYGRHLRHCPWCARRDRFGADPFPTDPATSSLDRTATRRDHVPPSITVESPPATATPRRRRIDGDAIRRVGRGLPWFGLVPLLIIAVLLVLGVSFSRVPPDDAAVSDDSASPSVPRIAALANVAGTPSRVIDIGADPPPTAVGCYDADGTRVGCDQPHQAEIVGHGSTGTNPCTSTSPQPAPAPGTASAPDTATSGTPTVPRSAGVLRGGGTDTCAVWAADPAVPLPPETT